MKTKLNAFSFSTVLVSMFLSQTALASGLSNLANISIPSTTSTAFTENKAIAPVLTNIPVTTVVAPKETATAINTISLSKDVTPKETATAINTISLSKDVTPKETATAINTISLSKDVTPKETATAINTISLNKDIPVKQDPVIDAGALNKAILEKINSNNEESNPTVGSMPKINKPTLDLSDIVNSPTTPTREPSNITNGKLNALKSKKNAVGANTRFLPAQSLQKAYFQANDLVGHSVYTGPAPEVKNVPKVNLH